MKLSKAYRAEFFSRVTPTDDGSCWIWPGIRRWYNYGSFKGRPAHRVMWEVLNGKIPDGLVVDHLCENYHCVNIHHLEPVTQAENTHRAYYGRVHTPVLSDLLSMKARHRKDWDKLYEKYGRGAVEQARRGRYGIPSKALKGASR